MTDDFGWEIIACHYTGRAVSLGDALRRSSPHPQAGVTLYLCDAEDAKAAHRANLAAFHEFDRNCNACRWFVRAKVDRPRGKPDCGFVYGACLCPNGRPELSPYSSAEHAVMCHPADPMHMPCWTARQSL